MNTPRVQTHASIDTSDLPASIAFYEALLGSKAALVRHDYARFQLDEPALVLGLNAVERAGGRTGSIQHLGLRFPDQAGLEAAGRRLEAAGAPTRREDDTECCYARLARVWATDPSGVEWELFFAQEEVVESTSRAGGSDDCCEPTCCGATEA
ncbi:MAG: VOC family protein [Planctomycetota bacterium]